MGAPPAPGHAAIPDIALPRETYAETRDVFLNGEPVQLFHVPAAHSDGDSLVPFRRSDVIVTGELFQTDSYPVIDLERGGSLQGLIDGLNRIIELTVPTTLQQGGTYVIPGHGRLSDESDVVEYRDMVTIVRDRIQHLIGEGRTLSQVKAARPTLDYDGRYGSLTGEWTTDMFIESAYRSLSQKPQPARKAK
jgi:cyclase